MKNQFMLVLGALLLSLSVHAYDDLGAVYNFGRLNVQKAGMSGSVLTLKKAGADEENLFYQFTCKKPGLLSKNQLVFKIIDTRAEDYILLARGNVANCTKTLKEIYRIAFSQKEQVDVTLTEQPDISGYYGLKFATSKVRLQD